jgi:hypothetical protein
MEACSRVQARPWLGLASTRPLLAVWKASFDGSDVHYSLATSLGLRRTYTESTKEAKTTRNLGCTGSDPIGYGRGLVLPYGTRKGP